MKFLNKQFVRWDDLDAMGHVNNAKYLTYAQEARFLWATEEFSGAMKETSLIEMVVARAEVDFIEHELVERLGAPFGAHWNGYPTPDKPLMLLLGGLALNLGELATAVQERTGLLLMVMNDGGSQEIAPDSGELMFGGGERTAGDRRRFRIVESRDIHFSA